MVETQGGLQCVIPEVRGLEKGDHLRKHHRLFLRVKISFLNIHKILLEDGGVPNCRLYGEAIEVSLWATRGGSPFKGRKPKCSTAKY